MRPSSRPSEQKKQHSVEPQNAIGLTTHAHPRTTLLFLRVSGATGERASAHSLQFEAGKLWDSRIHPDQAPRSEQLRPHRSFANRRQRFVRIDRQNPQRTEMPQIAGQHGIPMPLRRGGNRNVRQTGRLSLTPRQVRKNTDTPCCFQIDRQHARAIQMKNRLQPFRQTLRLPVRSEPAAFGNAILHLGDGDYREKQPGTVAVHPIH
jgi:hypothetical protein